MYSVWWTLSVRQLRLRSICMPNLPIIAYGNGDQPVHLVVTNVRCVPAFANYTLLSVDQLWEEQRIKSEFCDKKRAVLPTGQIIPFDPAAGHNSITAHSAVPLYEKGVLGRPKQSHQSTCAAFGFHHLTAVAHIGRLGTPAVS